MFNKDKLKALIERHSEINKLFEEGKEIDPELTKNFVTFPLNDPTLIYNNKNTMGELEEATFKMNEAKEMKMKAVNEMRWEDAAVLRDQERKFEKLVKELTEKDEIQ